MTTLLLAAAAQQAAGGSPPPVTFPVTDTFTRTVSANGWGTPDQGLAWSTTDTTGDFSVNGTKGVLVASSLDYHRMLQTQSVLDVNQTLDISMSAMPTGGFIDFQFFARYQDASNFYSGSIVLKNTGFIDAFVRKRTAGVNSDQNYQYQTISSVDAADTIYVRFDCYDDGADVTLDLYCGLGSLPGTVLSTWTDTGTPHGAGSFGLDMFTRTAVSNTPNMLIDNYSAS